MKARRSILTLVVAVISLGAAQEASAYYAAHMGRFTSRDPVGEMGRFGEGMPPDSEAAMGFIEREQFDPLTGYQDGMNLYQYVGSSPALLTDPSGLLVGEEVIIFEEVVVVCSTPVGGAAAACVVGPCIAYKVGQCTTGPLSKLFFDWCYEEKTCPPCPFPEEVSRRIDRVPPSRKHFPCPGDHEHVYTKIYNQDPATCECFPKIVDDVTCL